MLTLTVRHGLGHSLQASKSGLLEAWAKTTQGKQWPQFCERHGIEHFIRALEITHGPNGWHPHIHALLVLTGDFEGAQRAHQWLLNRWRRFVRRVLGAEFVPNSRGVVITPYERSDYIAKLAAWEITDPGSKKHGHEENRSPSEIAWDYVRAPNSRDAALWLEYCAETRGMRLLTWSRGLKELVGIGELTDQELADAEASQDDAQDFEIADSAWPRIVDRKGLRPRLLEIAESTMRTHPRDSGARQRALQQCIHDELRCAEQPPAKPGLAPGSASAKEQPPEVPPAVHPEEFPF